MQEHYTHMGMEDAGRAAALIGRVDVRKKEEKPPRCEKNQKNQKNHFFRVFLLNLL